MDTMALRKWCSPVLHRHMSEVIRNQKAAGVWLRLETQTLANTTLATPAPTGLQMDPNVLALEEVNMLMAKVG